MSQGQGGSGTKVPARSSSAREAKLFSGLEEESARERRGGEAGPQTKSDARQFINPGEALLRAYLPELVAIFFTMAKTSLRSLSLRLTA